MMEGVANHICFFYTGRIDAAGVQGCSSAELECGTGPGCGLLLNPARLSHANRPRHLDDRRRVGGS
jgi:hypothetical protein